MEDWQQQEQQAEMPLHVPDIVGKLYADYVEANMQFAVGKLLTDQWAAEMRLIDQKLAIFGLRLDRPERFAKPGGRI